MADQKWFEPARTRGAADLYCLPHAGGSGAQYRAWAEALAPVVTVRPVLLPGREARFAEPAIGSLTGLVAELAPALRAEAERRGRPYLIFGHSMGALVGSELVRALEAGPGPAPVRFLASGLVAPPLLGGRRRLHDAPTGEIVAWLRSFAMTPPALLATPGLLELFLPAVRADLRLIETYRAPAAPAPLRCDVDVLTGAADDTVTAAGCAAWADLTLGRTEVLTFPGDHFYLHPLRGELLAALTDRLGRLPLGAVPARP